MYMQLTQAIALLTDLAELEVLSPACPDPPPGWIHELKQAAKTAREYLASQRPESGRFFVSPTNGRGHNGPRR